MEKVKDSNVSLMEFKKTKEQIKAFISTVKAKTKLDEILIEKCCSNVGVKIEFIHQRWEEVTEITFEEFILWVKKDLPHRGAIIVLEHENLLCIVKFIGITKITITAILTSENKLSLEDRDIRFGSFRYANVEERKKLQRALYEKELGWTNYTYNLTKRFNPKEGEFVRISLLGEKIGLGVFRYIDKSGNVVMYCVKMKNESLRFCLHEVIGHITELQFEKISMQNRKIFIQELEDSNLSWNGHVKRIEPLNYRLKEGKLYSFINDYFEIIYTHDNYRQTDTCRLNAGNYFRARNEAKDMLNTIYSKLLENKKTRVCPGESYFYINTKNFHITQTKDNYKPKDLKRYSCHNYFIGSTDASELCLLISEFRKVQLYTFTFKDMSPQIKPKKKNKV